MTEIEGSQEDPNTITKSEFVLMVHDHLNQYIQLADSKSSLLLSAQIAYLGLFGNIVRTLWQNSGNWFKISVAFTAASLILAVLFAALAVYPRDPETNQGLIFWQSILRQNERSYRLAVLDASGEDLLHEVIDENYALAKVSDGKYDNVRRTMVFTGSGIFFSFVTGAIFFIL